MFKLCKLPVFLGIAIFRLHFAMAYWTVVVINLFCVLSKSVHQHFQKGRLSVK